MAERGEGKQVGREEGTREAGKARWKGEKEGAVYAGRQGPGAKGTPTPAGPPAHPPTHLSASSVRPLAGWAMRVDSSRISVLRRIGGRGG
jgi:hypothetical protein